MKLIHYFDEHGQRDARRDGTNATVCLQKALNKSENV